MRKDILLLSQQSQDLEGLARSLQRLDYSVAIASSPEQAVAQVSTAQPYLVILEAHQQYWSSALVETLRRTASTSQMTIVVLTDCHAPSWLPQEENPGFDGFLVKPISDDVLASLIQSAWARRTCLAAL